MPGLATGVLAGLLSALAYGSFAVPIKSRAVLEARVHPLIFQSYKSLMCFSTAWLVLFWTDFDFTWWATLAAFIWVMDGIVAIISIQLAGLGTAQTVWSCVSVFVSFAWGKVYFREPMQNAPLAVAGLALMLLGMIGLGWIASQGGHEAHSVHMPKETFVAVEVGGEDLQQCDHEEQTHNQEETEKGSASEIAFGDGGDDLLENLAEQNQHLLPEESGGGPTSSSGFSVSAKEVDPLTKGSPSGRGNLSADHIAVVIVDNSWLRHKYAWGVLGSIYVGICAGSMMICLKFAPTGLTEDQYTLSFGIGVGLVTVTALAFYSGVCHFSNRESPAFQVNVAAAPACLAGCLWSIGNYLSIVAVAHLGMAVGWPLVQCSLIVSNLWALVWYREVQGRAAVSAFLCSASVIIVGVFLLAFYGL